MPKRQRRAPTDNWQQLELCFTSSAQRVYELIRPVVLFGQSPAERAQQTGTAQRTIYRRVQRFAAEGMHGLFDEPAPPPSRTLPPRLRHLIVELKAEYAGLRPNEIATICYARAGRRPSPHTVKRVLAEEPPLLLVKRRFAPFHDTPDPAQRRKAILRLHAEGWNAKSIAGYLGTSRETVYQTLRRWIAEGVHGLARKSSARRPGGRKVTLKAVHAIRRLQQNTGLGEWRVHAALRQAGIILSPRTVGRVLALNRALYALPLPPRAPHEKRAMPFRAIRRHQFWTCDIRYLAVPALGDKVYCISILDNYSRAILASAVSPKQDLTAFLLVLYAAVRQHGAPEALVTDGGGVFRATHALDVYARLGIVKEQIAKRQAWQSYIETAFNVQRRMADAAFAQATTWDDLRVAHDRWVADYNFQHHWAHRQREDGRHSPAEVLGWVHGRTFAPDELHRTFHSTRFKRRLDMAGYVRFRHWRVYGEYGLAQQPAVVWLYGETLTVTFDETPLAAYRVSYQPDRRQLRTITEPHLFVHPHRSPQQMLWELGEDDWLKVQRLPLLRRRPRSPLRAIQERLFEA